ncbi:MAG: hypothetical protein LBO04_02095 [Spirochaetaceae bacterium]|jgi:hypothetical protein|nr:hypothetical protein [Spirochaetaceae bacterium]
MKRNTFVCAGMILLLVLFFAGCASVPKFQNTVSGTSWSYGPDEDGMTVFISFTSAKNAEITMDVEPIAGSYIDVDKSGKNGALTILKWEGAKMQFAETMLQVGRYGTNEFTLFKRLSENSDRSTVANSRWRNRTDLPIELNFLSDGKATAELHMKVSGTYKFTSADTIVITSDYGLDMLKIVDNGLTFEDFTLTKK